MPKKYHKKRITVTGHPQRYWMNDGKGGKKPVIKQIDPYPRMQRYRDYKTISREEAIRRFNQKSKKARAIDISKTSKKLLDKPNEYWVEHMERSDVKNIDTKEKLPTKIIKIYKENKTRANNPYEIEIEDITPLSHSEFKERLRNLNLKRDQWKRFNPTDVYLKLDGKLEGFKDGKWYDIEKLLSYKNGEIIAIIKDQNKTIDKLVKLGGKRWQKYEKDRIYFNAVELAKMMGYDWSHYKTGNISYAEREGKKISNSEMYRVLNDLNCKLYYDIEDKQFHYYTSPGSGMEHTEKAIKKLKKEIAKIENKK